MRTSIIATAVLLGAILAACGGGGSSAPSGGAVGAQPPISPNYQVNTSFSGPTAQLSVTIAIPRHNETEAAVSATRTRIQAIHGKKVNDASIRTMANTAASAQVRDVGRKLNAWATAYEKSTGRIPDYISGGTEYMEIDVYSGSTMVQDSYFSCSSQQPTCTGTLTLPVGTGYTVSMYLYDYCYYLLAAGVANNVAVNGGTNNPLTITLNGVVAYFDSTFTPTSLTMGNAQNNLQLTLTAVDSDYYTITTPGMLITNGFVPITGVSIMLDGTYTDVTPTSTVTLPVPTPTQSPSTAFAFGPATYMYGGTGNESSVNFTATAIATGAPIISTTPNGGSDTTGDTSYFGIDVNPEALFIVAGPSPVPSALGLPAYMVTTTNQASSQTTTGIEFAAPTPAPIAVSLSVSANFNDSGSALTLSNDSCSGPFVIGNSLNEAFPSPYPSTPPQPGATMPPGGAPYTFSIQVSGVDAPGTCSFTVTDGTDGNNLSAVTTLEFDSTTLNVSGKARRP